MSNAAHGDAGNRVGLTMKRCSTLPCPSGKDRIYYHDTQVPALCLCVTAAGTRTFYVYRRVNGSPSPIRLGEFPELIVDVARKEAQRVNFDVANGLDPQALKRARRGEKALADLFEHFLENHSKPHKKTWTEDVRTFNMYFAGWKNRKLSAIRHGDVQALHARLGRDNGKYQANRALSLLQTMFTKSGRANDYTGPNPARGITKFNEQSRDRFLRRDEMPRFFEALAAEPSQTMRDFFTVALLTGARRGNALAMRWEQLNLDAVTWRIPETKNGESVTLPLVPEVVDILRRRQESANGSPWVFPGRRRNGNHLLEPKGAWRRILKRAGLENLRIHDLRRTLGSWQAAGGASLPIIGKSLGHKNMAATAIYARLDLDPVRLSVNTATTAILAAGQKKEGATDGGQPQG